VRGLGGSGDRARSTHQNLKKIPRNSVLKVSTLARPGALIVIDHCNNHCWASSNFCEHLKFFTLKEFENLEISIDSLKLSHFLCISPFIQPLYKLMPVKNRDFKIFSIALKVFH
jgi:hypothetical protein